MPLINEAAPKFPLNRVYTLHTCSESYLDNPPAQPAWVRNSFPQDPEVRDGAKKKKKKRERRTQVRLVVFESAVDGFFLINSDLPRRTSEDLTSNSLKGPTGLEGMAPTSPVRLNRARPHSISKKRIALIPGVAGRPETGSGAGAQPRHELR